MTAPAARSGTAPPEAEAVPTTHNGEEVLLPLLEGRSTTRLLSTTKGNAS